MYAGSMRILGVAGSLRSGSLNHRLLEAAAELAPRSFEFEIFDLGDLPFYNQDLDIDGLRPSSVEAFKGAIDSSAALLISTPEFNHGIPGVLQNALDWASRPALRSVLAGKPVGIMGVSPSPIGTARAQAHLRQVLQATLALVLPHPGVLVGNALEKFDVEGRLIDEPTREFVRGFMSELESWIQRVATPVGAG